MRQGNNQIPQSNNLAPQLTDLSLNKDYNLNDNLLKDISINITQLHESIRTNYTDDFVTMSNKTRKEIVIYIIQKLHTFVTNDYIQTMNADIWINLITIILCKYDNITNIILGQALRYFIEAIIIQCGLFTILFGSPYIGSNESKPFIDLSLNNNYTSLDIIQNNYNSEIKMNLTSNTIFSSDNILNSDTIVNNKKSLYFNVLTKQLLDNNIHILNSFPSPSPIVKNFVYNPIININDDNKDFGKILDIMIRYLHELVLATDHKYIYPDLVLNALSRLYVYFMLSLNDINDININNLNKQEKDPINNLKTNLKNYIVSRGIKAINCDLFINYDFNSNSYMKPNIIKNLLPYINSFSYNATMFNNPIINSDGITSSSSSVLFNSANEQYISIPSFST